MTLCLRLRSALTLALRPPPVPPVREPVHDLLWLEARCDLQSHKIRGAFVQAGVLAVRGLQRSLLRGAKSHTQRRTATTASTFLDYVIPEMHLKQTVAQGLGMPPLGNVVALRVYPHEEAAGRRAGRCLRSFKAASIHMRYWTRS
jgi:hypothetical protein